MPTYPDENTLSPEGQDVYNAILADGVKFNSWRLTWGKQLVKAYDTDKVLFEAVDVVDEAVTPLYVGLPAIDFWVGQSRIKRVVVAPGTPYGGPGTGQVVITKESIETALTKATEWMLGNSATITALLAAEP